MNRIIDFCTRSILYPLDITYLLMGFYHYQKRGGIAQFLIPVVYLDGIDRVQWFFFKEVMPRRTPVFLQWMFLLYNTRLEDDEFPLDVYFLGGRRSMSVLFLLFYYHSNPELPTHLETTFYFLVALIYSDRGILAYVSVVVGLIALLKYGRGEIGMVSDQHEKTQHRLAIERAERASERYGYSIRRAIAYLHREREEGAYLSDHIQEDVLIPVRRRDKVEGNVRQDNGDAAREGNGEGGAFAPIEDREPDE